jgi:hypothetical protein
LATLAGLRFAQGAGRQPANNKANGVSRLRERGSMRLCPAGEPFKGVPWQLSPASP